jgi:hypothetical protein
MHGHSGHSCLVCVPVSEDLIFFQANRLYKTSVLGTNRAASAEDISRVTRPSRCLLGSYASPTSEPSYPESRRAVPTVDHTVTKGTTAPTTAAPSGPYKPNISVNQARAGGKPTVSTAACHGCLNGHPAKGGERFRVSRHRHRLREGLPVVTGTTHNEARRSRRS